LGVRRVVGGGKGGEVGLGKRVIGLPCTRRVLIHPLNTCQGVLLVCTSRRKDALGQCVKRPTG
jgi:hypothetical protein